MRTRSLATLLFPLAIAAGCTQVRDPKPPVKPATDLRIDEPKPEDGKSGEPKVDPETVPEYPPPVT